MTQQSPNPLPGHWPSFDLQITGSFTLEALRYALSRNGCALAYPEAKKNLPVTLWGNYDAPRLAHALERQTQCQVIARPHSLHLRFTKTHKFTLIEPNFQAGTKDAYKIPGITVTQIGRYDWITGPDTELPLLARLMKTIYDKPPQIRIDCYIIDDTAADNLDFQITPGTSAINFSQIQSFWKNASIAINALTQYNTIKTKFQTILQPNEDTTFTNTDERYVQEFSTTPAAQTSSAILSSGLTGISAGLTIALKPQWTKNYWQITGKITDSGFSGTQTLSDILAKSINFTCDMSDGQLLRIATMTTATHNNEMGLPNFAPTYNRDRNAEHWSLWLQITPLYPNERNPT